MRGRFWERARFSVEVTPWELRTLKTVADLCGVRSA